MSRSLPLDWIDNELRELQRRDLRRHLPCRESPPVGGEIQLDGQRLVNFSSNDYLSIAADSVVVDAVISRVGQAGWGAGASSLVTGRGVMHRQLEAELARLKQTDSALLFPTGYAANLGTITALVGREDAVFSDEKNHASIIDGCRLSRAPVHVYRHNDPQHLNELLRSAPAARRRLIVTDSLFSMDGDFAPLPELADIAESYDAMLMVDEAHATGVWGERGSGACELQEVERQIPIRVGTLSKALGSLGGFVAGSQALIDWVANRARTYIFSTAQPEAVAAASLAALELVGEQPQRRRRLQQSSAWLREQLVARGWNCGRSQSQIIPLIVGPARRALELSQQLRQQGILAPAIRPPAVPAGESILRISVTSGHSDEQLQRLVDILDELAAEPPHGN